MTTVHAPDKGFTRRQALILAGGAGLAVLLHGPPAVAESGAPDPARLAVLGALAGGLAAGAAPAARDAVVALHVERYAAFYAEADPLFRPFADGVLDAVEEANPGFALLDADRALAQLDAWTRDERHQLLAGAALELACMSFDEDEERRPVTAPSLIRSAA